MSEEAEVQILKENLSQVRFEVSGIREDLRDLTRAFRQLVRVETRLQEVSEKMKDYEKRVRYLEQFHQSHSALDGLRWGVAQWAVTFILGGGLSIVTGIIVWHLR